MQSAAAMRMAAGRSLEVPLPVREPHLCYKVLRVRLASMGRLKRPQLATDVEGSMLPKSGAHEIIGSHVGALPLSSDAPFLMPSWARARDRACAALLAGQRVLVVTGPAGAGKTLLLQDIARLLVVAGWRVATSIDPGDGAQADPMQSAVLIDDADRLPGPELTSLQRNHSGALLLVGRDVLAARCPGQPRVSVPALPQDEANEFINAWLARNRALARIDDRVAARIAALSAGIAGVITDLLRLSLRLADAAGVDRVLVAHVDAAAASRDSLNRAKVSVEPADPLSSGWAGDSVETVEPILFEVDDAALGQVRPHPVPLPGGLLPRAPIPEKVLLADTVQTSGAESTHAVPSPATFAIKRPGKAAVGSLAFVVVCCAIFGASVYHLGWVRTSGARSLDQGRLQTRPEARASSRSEAATVSPPMSPSAAPEVFAPTPPLHPSSQAPARATVPALGIPTQVASDDVPKPVRDQPTLASAIAPGPSRLVEEQRPGLSPGETRLNAGPPLSHTLVVVHPTRAADGAVVVDALGGKIGLTPGQVTVGEVGHARSSATIRLFRAGDHKLARRLGDELAAMGIAWRIENLANGATRDFERPVEVWLPSR